MNAGTKAPRPKFSMFRAFQYIHTIRYSNGRRGTLIVRLKKKAKVRKRRLNPASEFRFNLLRRFPTGPEGMQV